VVASGNSSETVVVCIEDHGPSKRAFSDLEKTKKKRKEWNNGQYPYTGYEKTRVDG
jgi:hypothetical protein